MKSPPHTSVWGARDKTQLHQTGPSTQRGQTDRQTEWETQRRKYLPCPSTKHSLWWLRNGLCVSTSLKKSFLETQVNYHTGRPSGCGLMSKGRDLNYGAQGQMTPSQTAQSIVSAVATSWQQHTRGKIRVNITSCRRPGSRLE